MVIGSTVTSTTLFAVIVAVSNAIASVFKYLLQFHNTKHDKNVKKQKKINEANKQLEDACNNGNLSELIDATKKVGEAKR